MDDTAGPPRTSDVAAMGSESDDATSSNSSKTRPVDDDDASPVSAGSVSDDEYRNRSSIRAASPESHAPAAAAVTTSCPTITTPSMPHPQPLPPGCGCVAAAADQDEITVCITPTTGGQFELAVDRNDTVENLKKIISKKLKVAKERICLLHRERQLREGTLAENGLQNDSRLTLLPSVETGLLAQRPEQSVMQALESLNDSQVNDFLSGKAPLNLTMRLGDHMMLIQLQLSTVTPATPTATQVSSTSGNGHNHHSNSNSSSSNSNVVGLSNSGNATSVSNLSGGHSSLQTTRRCLTAKSPANIVKPQNAAGAPAGRTSHLISNLASALHAAASYSSSSSSSSNSSNSSSLPTASITTTTTSPVCSSRVTTSSSSVTAAPISPTHLSSSASGNPGQSTRSNSHGVSSTNGNSSSACQPCPLYHHHHHHHGHHHHNHHYHHHHHHHHHYSKNKSNVPNLSSSFFPSSFSSGLSQIQGQSALESASYDATLPRKKLCSGHHHHGQSSSSVTTGSMDVTRSQQEDSNPQSPTCTSSLMLEQSPPKPATLDTRALAEASRNLTQKLKQLSSEVLTSRVDLAEENARRRQGAIIESMHHHGKGVYSGTFSGTLNPALQDRHGRPKRDISTIIHILNDLLCATPAASAGHYRHHHHRHSHTRQQSSSMSASAGTTAAANGPTTSIGCNDSTPGYSSEELSKENEATKGKMRRLRLVMEQRRAKRKARRQARAAPYTTQWAAMTPADPNHEPNTSTPTSGTTTTTNSAEPQNEPELQPCSPEPVVA